MVFLNSKNVSIWAENRGELFEPWAAAFGGCSEGNSRGFIQRRNGGFRVVKVVLGNNGTSGVVFCSLTKGFFAIESLTRDSQLFQFARLHVLVFFSTWTSVFQKFLYESKGRKTSSVRSTHQDQKKR